MTPEEITPSQRSYASSLLLRLGYGDRVTVAWAPLLRQLGMNPGIGQRVDQWLPTLTKRDASRLIEALKEDE